MSTISQLSIAPGTVVLNQDTNNPQAGLVIAPPDGERDHPISLWVHWADGQIELEAAADVMLTAHVYVRTVNA